MKELSKEKKNKFELILIAAKRARDISKNNNNKLTHQLKEKTTILALKEIASVYKDEINIE